MKKGEQKTIYTQQALCMKFYHRSLCKTVNFYVIMFSLLFFGK